MSLLLARGVSTLTLRPAIDQELIATSDRAGRSAALMRAASAECLLETEPRTRASTGRLAQVGQLGDRLAELASRLPASEGELGAHLGVGQAMSGAGDPRRLIDLTRGRRPVQ